MTKYTGSFISESQLVKVVQDRLSVYGYRTFSEVPFMYRSIDVVVLDGKGRYIAIEAKIADWRRAIQQAKPCLLGADKVYIVMPASRTSCVDMDVLRQFGIGLVAVGVGAPRVLVRARRSSYRMAPYAKALKEAIGSRDQDSKGALDGNSCAIRNTPRP